MTSPLTVRRAPRPCPEFPHLVNVVRWTEHLPSGVPVECSADVAREAALAAMFPDREPVTWKWQGRRT